MEIQANIIIPEESVPLAPQENAHIQTPPKIPPILNISQDNISQNGGLNRPNNNNNNNYGLKSTQILSPPPPNLDTLSTQSEGESGPETITRHFTKNYKPVFLVYTSTLARSYIEILLKNQFGVSLTRAINIENSGDRDNSHQVLEFIKSEIKKRKSTVISDRNSRGIRGSSVDRASLIAKSEEYLIVFSVVQVGDKIPWEEYEGFIYECAIQST